MVKQVARLQGSSLPDQAATFSQKIEKKNGTKVYRCRHQLYYDNVSITISRETLFAGGGDKIIVHSCMHGYLPQDLYTICCPDFDEAGHHD